MACSLFSSGVAAPEGTTAKGAHSRWSRSLSLPPLDPPLENLEEDILRLNGEENLEGSLGTKTSLAVEETWVLHPC